MKHFKQENWSVFSRLHLCFPLSLTLLHKQPLNNYEFWIVCSLSLSDGQRARLQHQVQAQVHWEGSSVCRSLQVRSHLHLSGLRQTCFHQLRFSFVNVWRAGRQHSPCPFTKLGNGRRSAARCSPVQHKPIFIYLFIYFVAFSRRASGCSLRDDSVFLSPKKMTCQHKK